LVALGPIFPQLPVYGKELGISSVVMGTVTGILPFAFLVATSLRCAGRHVQKVQEMYIYYTGGNPGVILCCDIFHTPKAPVEVNL
jgi:hypothetical protein